MEILQDEVLQGFGMSLFVFFIVFLAVCALGILMRTVRYMSRHILRVPSEENKFWG